MDGEVDLNDLNALEVLYESRDTTVYRARYADDGSGVVFKVSHATAPGAARRRFDREAEWFRRLSGKGFSRLRRVVLLRGEDALEFDDRGGTPVSRLIASGPMPWRDAVRLLSDAARALAHLHELGGVHGDVHPGNLLVDEHGRFVEWIDLGEVIDLSATPNRQGGRLVGAPRYVSPERTGRQSIPISSAADIYSLGMVGFALLTGRPAYLHESLEDVILAHLRETPPSVDSLVPSVPAAVAGLIHRMLARDASERPASAGALAHALESLWERQTDGSAPLIGGRDAHIAQPRWEAELVARTGPAQRVRAAVVSARGDRSSVVIVPGPSGIGKSALLDDVRSRLDRDNTLWARGKAEQGGLAEQGPLGLALQALVARALEAPGPGLAATRASLQAALHAHPGTGALRAMVSDLDLLLEPATDAAAEAVDEASSGRYLIDAVQRLLRTFTEPATTVVLSLDDLQWAPPTDIEVFEALATIRRVPRVCLIGSFRDNEITSNSHLERMLERVRATGSGHVEIRLEPLDRAALSTLVRATFPGPFEHESGLLDWLEDHAEGNPLFARQMLRSAFEARSVHVGDEGAWEWQPSSRRQVRVVDGVEGLLVERLERLEPATKCLLGYAALIGPAARVDVVAHVMRMSAADAIAHLDEAVVRGLGSLDPNPLGVPHFEFAHDRIQEAALRRFEDDQQQTAHLDLARAWLACGVSRGAAQHYQHVSASELDDAEKGHAFELLAQAADHAGRATDYARASALAEAGLGFTEVSFASIPEHARHALAIDLVAYQVHSGRFRDADLHYELLTPPALEAAQRARLEGIRLDQLLLEGRLDEAVELTVDVLGRLGWPATGDLDQARTELDAHHAAIREMLDRDDAESGLDPRSVDDDQRLAVHASYAGFLAAYLSGRTLQAFAFLAIMARISLERGNVPLSSYGYVGYGMVAQLDLLDPMLGAEIAQRGVDLAVAYGDPWTAAKTHFLHAADVASWTHPYREARGHYEVAWDHATAAGDWLTIGYIVMQMGADLFTCSEPLGSFYRTWTEHLDTLRATGNQDGLDLTWAGSLDAAWQLMHAGDPEARPPWDRAAFEARHADNSFYLAWSWSSRIRLAWHLGHRNDFETALIWLQTVLSRVPSHANKLPSCTLYAGLIAYALLDDPDTGDDARAQAEAAVTECHDRLQGWARYAPTNFAHLEALLDAARLIREGQAAAAADRLEDAAELAAEGRFHAEEAVAWELRARLANEAGRPTLAARHAQRAADAAQHWGASAVFRRLQRRWPNVRPLHRHASGSHGTSSPTLRVSTERLLDASLVRNLADAIGRSLDPDDLARDVLRATSRYAAAQSGALLTVHNDHRTFVEATLSADGTLDVPRRELDHYGDASPVPPRIVRYAMRTRRPLCVGCGADEGQLDDDPWLDTHRVRALLVVPLVSADQLHGCVVLAHHETPDAFRREHVDTLAHLSAQVATALSHARLFAAQSAGRRQLEEEVALRTSDLRSALDKLATTQAELVRSARLASLGSMVAGVAHELNTPLGVASTALELLYQEVLADPDTPAPSSRARRAHDLATRNVARAARVVASFKGLAAPSAVGRCIFPLVERLQRVVELTEPRFETMHLDVRIDIRDDAEHAQVDGEPDRFDEMIVNLIDNAGVHAYRGEGGPVWISVTLDRPGHVLLVVRDEGVGMDDVALQRCTDPFFTTARDRGGTGLGLALVHTTVTAGLSGTLEVLSEASGGCTFSIRLPMASHQPADMAPSG